MTQTQFPEVGAQDDERKNSLVVDDELLEECGAGMPDASPGVCYFNDVCYPEGAYVRSGSELLCCDKGGVWIRKAALHE